MLLLVRMLHSPTCLQVKLPKYRGCKYCANTYTPILFIDKRQGGYNMSMNSQELLAGLKSQNLAQINRGTKRTHSFPVDFSSVDPSFVGTFVVHHPASLEKVEIGRTRSILLGGVPAVDVETDNLVHVLATLNTIVDVKPDWFDIDNPDIDFEVLFGVYDEYVKWVNSFRSQPRTDTNTPDSQNGGGKVPVVDTKNVPSLANGQ